ncbi:T-box transcription factor TBX22 [Arapaima gigas]
MQGLSSRAHAFSVEALVGNTARKRMKAEQSQEEKGAGPSEPLSAEEEEEERESQGERRRKGTLVHGRPAECSSEVDAEVTVELQGSDLWNRFHEIGTEMIITKAGRRMFPSVRVKVRNLDPFKQYYVAMDVMPVDSKRYRYVYHSSQWMVAGNTDHSCIAPRLYVHPDSPCSGETWMRQVISFDRVKLTNNEMDDKGHIILQSMHKYKPRIHIIEHDPRLDLSQVQSLPAEGVHSFSFPETQFTTVTAYQNQQITKLKIDRNPFAKGFRDPGRNRGVLDGILESYPWRTPISLDLKPFSIEPQGGSCGSPMSCGTQAPLKGLLPAPCSAPSFPFSVPRSDAAFSSLSLPLCYKVSPSAGLLGGRHCSFPGADRLCDYLGWQPMVEHPFLSALHGKKGGSCRAQCVQGPSASPANKPPLQGTGGTGIHQTSLHQEPLPPPLASPYSLYSYGLQVGSHFSSVTRNLKLDDCTPLTTTDGLFPPAPWHPTINHCL